MELTYSFNNTHLELRELELSICICGVCMFLPEKVRNTQPENLGADWQTCLE